MHPEPSRAVRNPSPQFCDPEGVKEMPVVLLLEHFRPSRAGMALLGLLPEESPLGFILLLLPAASWQRAVQKTG